MTSGNVKKRPPSCGHDWATGNKFKFAGSMKFCWTGAKPTERVYFFNTRLTTERCFQNAPAEGGIKSSAKEKISLPI